MDGEKITGEDKRVIEQVLRLLASEKYITLEEQLRMLELLEEEK